MVTQTAGETAETGFCPKQLLQRKDRHVLKETMSYFWKPHGVGWATTTRAWQKTSALRTPDNPPFRGLRGEARTERPGPCPQLGWVTGPTGWLVASPFHHRDSFDSWEIPKDSGKKKQQPARSHAKSGPGVAPESGEV